MNYETNLFRTNLTHIIKFFMDSEDFVPQLFTVCGMKPKSENISFENYRRTAENGYSSFYVYKRNSCQNYLLLGNEQEMAYVKENDISSRNYISLRADYVEKMSLSKYKDSMPNICLITKECIYEIDGKALINSYISSEGKVAVDLNILPIVWINYTDFIIRKMELNSKPLTKIQQFRYNVLQNAVIQNLDIRGLDYVNFYAYVYDKTTGSLKGKVKFETIEAALKMMKIDISERTMKRRIADGKQIETENSYVILSKRSSI